MKESVLLQRRFRGALLGLMRGLEAGISTNLSKCLMTSAYGNLSTIPDMAKLCAAVDDSAGYRALSATMLVAAVPGLLRNHDSWQRRWAWLGSNTTDAIVPILVLGDVLEIVLCSHTPVGLDGVSLDGLLSEFTRLQSGPTRYDLSSSHQRYYQRTLASISSGILSGGLSNANLSDANLSDANFPQTAFEGSVVNALRHPESCVLPVRLSAQMFVHNLGSGGPVSALRVAPAIAGLVGGAMGSQSSLSVLWQVRLGQDRANEENVSRSEIMAIADYLYTQWAGIHLASES